MDVTLIKIIDIIKSEDEETGEITTQKLYLPTIMLKKDIEDICPYVTTQGSLYKNVTLIKKYNGENCTVVGNYKNVSNIVHDHITTNPIGFSLNNKENEKS